MSRNIVVVGTCRHAVHVLASVTVNPLAEVVATAANVAEVVGVELKGIGPVGVLQVVEDTLRRRAHLLGVELHGGDTERLQALCDLLLLNLVAVNHELIQLGVRKERVHLDLGDSTSSSKCLIRFQHFGKIYMVKVNASSQAFSQDFQEGP